MHQAIQLALRYQQWQNNDKTEKVDIISAISDVFAELNRQLRDTLLHTYVKRKQAATWILISKCDGENGNFSKNATIASQNETQSAHWCHGQATHFTVCAWIKEDENEFLSLCQMI